MDSNLALKLLAAVDKFMIGQDVRVHVDNPTWSAVRNASFDLELSLNESEHAEWMRLTKGPGSGIG